MCTAVCTLLGCAEFCFQIDDTSSPVMTLQLIGCADFSDLAAAAGLQLEGVMPITSCLREVPITLCHIAAITGGSAVVYAEKGCIPAAGLSRYDLQMMTSDII